MSQTYRADRPVFDVANDNRLLPALLDHTERLDTADLDDAPIRQARVLSLEEKRQAMDARRDSAIRTKLRLAEDHARLCLRRSQISRRQSIGDEDLAAANDNSDWPLQGVLRREGLVDELAIAQRYRQLVRTSRYELRGQDVSELPYLDRDSKKPDPEASVDAFAASGFAGDQKAAGEIKTKGTYRLKRPQAGEAPKRATPSTEETKRAAHPIPKPFDNAAICNALDARKTLAELHYRLGCRLVEPLEDAVLACERFEDIGRNLIGIDAEKAASGAGRALVLTALRSLIDIWSEIDHREHRKSAVCARRRRLGF